MYIRTQDKKHWFMPDNLNIERNIGSKKKYMISSNIKGLTVVIVGVYETEEEAILELDHIQSFAEDNPNGTYSVR